MTWQATSKEVERSNFFKEVPRILRRFRVPFTISVLLIAGMVVVSTSVVPLAWRIQGEAWAVIMGAGGAFEDVNNPQPVVRVGDANSQGVVEITDMIFTTRGPGECSLLPYGV